MRDFSADHRWLSINSATLRGAGKLDTIIEACARHGIRAISPWRDQVAAIGLERTAALVALAAGDRGRFEAILEPTVPLSRHIFQAPTRFYKTGVVFMAWLNGHQSHFTMVGGQQSTRSIQHFSELFRLADAAGLLADPDMAAARMRSLLAVHGVA